MKRRFLIIIATLVFMFAIFTIPSYAVYESNGSLGRTISIDEVRKTIDFFCNSNNSYQEFDLKGETLILDKEIILCAKPGSTLEIYNGTIDCQNKCRLFDIETKGFTLKMYNIIVENCSAKNGAAIHVGSNNVTISNPNNDDSFIIKDCKASNCGGAIKMDAYSDGSKISNVVFESCEAGDDGGAIITNGNGNTIENCQFTKCSCKDAGGAIYVWDPCSVNGCTFAGNSAEAQEGISYGNDIYLADYLKLNGCTFTDHSRSQALYLYGDDYLTEDSGNSFASNISTIMSEGRLWIIGGIAVIAIAALLFIIRKKSKKATQ